jgi:hypothetical protein
MKEVPLQWSRERSMFAISSDGSIIYSYGKMHVYFPSLLLCTIIKSKKTKNVNMNYKTMKFYIHDLGISKNLLSRIQKVLSTKDEIDELSY